MNKKNYKEIAGIMKTLYDDFERFLLEVDKKIFGTGKAPIGFYKIKEKRVNDLADYFEREQNKLLQRIPKVSVDFNRKQFLKDCGVE